MPLWIEGVTKEEKTKKKSKVSGVPICLLQLKRNEKMELRVMIKAALENYYSQSFLISSTLTCATLFFSEK